MQKTCHATAATRLAEVPHAISTGRGRFPDRFSGCLLPEPCCLEALELRPLGRLGDALDGKLRGSVRIEQTVSLLIGIRELSVAKTRQKGKFAHRIQKLEVGAFQVVAGLDLAVSPTFIA